ncbi:MAG TPA: heavy metal-associated domain-containing protein [Porphyromonadaceae bacterium]|nr:heavy metal-associated domain-containing protein [Porphyromonadaceae bacterium]
MEILNSLLFMLGEMSPYILLGFLIAGLMHSFVPADIFARHLSGRGWGAVAKAAAVGVPLPLCSCGVLPAAVAMRRGGASRAASTSFLIATPQTGVDSIAATWSLLGPAFAVIRPVAALVTALVGGRAVGAVERPDAQAQVCVAAPADAGASRTFAGRLAGALRYGFVDLVDSIGVWLVAGLVVAALITVYVPADFFSSLGDAPLLAMLLVVLVAVPMYVCATGSIPIALSLMLKGLSPGTALVLLMAGPAANFASFALISREMGRKAAVVYLLSIVAGAMAFGLAVDYLLPSAWFDVAVRHGGCAHGAGVFTWVCSVVMALLLAASLVRRFFARGRNLRGGVAAEYHVTGMNCPHCQGAVARAIGGVEGVTGVDVSLSTGVARVQGRHDAEAVVRAVRAAGFDVDGDR